MTKNWINRIGLAALTAILTLVATLPAQAQQTVTQTTLSAALSLPTQTNPARTVSVTSATGITVGTELFVDGEALLVTAQNSVTTTLLTVQRGVDGTRVGQHASGAITYAGPTAGITGSPFVFNDPPVGACTLTGEVYSLRINVTNGQLWQCSNSVWMNVIDQFMFIGPGSCFGSTTTGTLTTPAAVGNVNVYATTWTGLINSSTTAPGTPVIQVATTNAAGAAINTVSCQIPVPSRTNASKGSYLVDATWIYGLQQNVANATQVATEASGLLNGVVAFGKITLPTPAASETASTVAQARADAGTMVLLPAKAAFNNAITTTGAFATQKITPQDPIALTTDLTIYYANFTVLHTTTVASTLQVAGVMIHYRTVTGY